MSDAHVTVEEGESAEAAVEQAPLAAPAGGVGLSGVGRVGSLPAALRVADSGLRARTALALQRACGNAAVARLARSTAANGGARAASPRVLARSPLDPLDTGVPSWLEAERERQAELERAETGPGRETTLQRLAAMSDRDAREQAPGIAYRAQDRGDAGLAVAASARLLRAWLASSDRPVTFTSAFGPEDAVDALIERADRAFRASQIELGGNYLTITIIQLVRAAKAVVSRRSTSDNPALQALQGVFDSMQRSDENEVRQRVQRVRQMIQTFGRGVAQRGDAAEMRRFEAMAKGIQSAERRAGPSIPEEVGEIGEPEAAGGRARAAQRAAPSGRATPPAQPRSTPQQPASRAAEAIVNSRHPDLDGALVIVSSAPRKYGNIRSPRYGVAGTLAGAHRMARELFGQRSAVIVEDIHARDPQGRTRQIRYLVLALSLRLDAPTPAPGEANGLFGFRNIEILLQPASRQYFFVAVSTGPWLFFAATLVDYVRQIQRVEAKERAAGIEPPRLTPETRRESLFGPIDRLIAGGETQEAADQLTYVSAEGFGLVDTATKTRYVATLLKAFTLEAHERTVVEVFRSVRGAAELREILYGLHREGVLRQLHTDLESAFSSLLIVVGQSVGAGSLTQAQTRRLLSELKILSPFPGIEVRADGSIVLTDAAAELRTAIEQLITTLTSLVTGIIDILLDPETFAKGLYKLAYFAVMADLASKGHPDATRYVNSVIEGIARQIGAAIRGLAALQENMPPGVDFVRDLQRAIEWRIVWEVLGLFIGVGEAVAFVDAVRSGRAGAALAEVATALTRSRPVLRAAETVEETAEAARLAERGAQAAGREAREAAGDAARAGRASGEATRDVANGARVRYRADGTRTLCINPCAELGHLSLSEDVIDAAVRNLSPARTRDLVEVLALYKSPREVALAESLVQSLARGGDEAASAAARLEEIAALRRGATAAPPTAAGAATPPAGAGATGPAPHPTPPAAPATPPAPPRITAPPAHAYVVDPRTAGTGGIRSIDVQLTARNEAQVTISGRVQPALPTRAGLEDRLPLPSQVGLRDYDRAHLWARTLGDEAAEGVMYAPKAANVGLQEVLEHQIRGMAEHAGAGQHVVLRARATSYPRTEGAGALARRFEYDIALVEDSGRVVERTGIVMEIPGPDEIAHVGIPQPRVIPGGLTW